MFEKFTEQARKVIHSSLDVARKRGAALIEPDDLLLGLLAVDGNVEARLALPSGIVDAIAAEVRGRHRPASPITADLPLNQAAKYVLAYAAEESEKCGHRHIGIEHLLVGLVRGEAHVGGQTLKNSGIDLTRARRGLIFTKCAPSARRVLFLARYEALTRGSSQVDIDDLLLGLIRETKETFALIVPSVTATLSIRKEVESSRITQSSEAQSLDLPFSDELQQVLSYANRGSDNGDKYWISGLHLLAGLLQLETSRTAAMLARHGVLLPEVYRALEQPAPQPAKTEEKEVSGNELLLLKRLLLSLEFEVTLAGTMPLYSLALTNELEGTAVAWCYEPDSCRFDDVKARALLDQHLAFVAYRTIGDAVQINDDKWKLAAVLWRLKKSDPPTSPSLDALNADSDRSLLAVLNAKGWQRASAVVEVIGRIRRHNWNLSVTISAEQYSNANGHWCEGIKARKEFQQVVETEYRTAQIQPRDRALLGRVLYNLAMEAEYTKDLPIGGLDLAEQLGNTVVSWSYNNTNRELDTIDAKRFLDSGLLLIGFRTNGFGAYTSNSPGSISVFWQLERLPGVGRSDLDNSALDQETDRRCIEALVARGCTSELAGSKVRVLRNISEVVNAMEQAISSHDFEKARAFSDQERSLREQLRRLQKEQRP